MNSSPMPESPDQDATPEPEMPTTDQDAPPGGWPDIGKGFLVFLALASTACGMALLVPAVLTLSIKSTEIDARNATTILSVAAGVSGVFQLIAFPVLGRISDRLTNRLGRRRPFLLIGALLLGIGAVGTIAAPSMPLLVAAHVATALGYCSAVVAFTAVIPDQLPPERRGPASAIVGLHTPVGALLGTFIAQALSPNLPAMILVPAGIAVVCCLLLAGTLRDRQVAAVTHPRSGLRELAGTFWVNPLRYPSFAWAWISRLMVFIGVGTVQAYQAFYLINVLGFAPSEVAGAVFLSTLVLTGMALVFAPIAGKVSDRIGRRKPFVIAAALIFGTGLLLTALAQSFPMFLAAIAVVGLGQGIYFAVDIALVTQVLPDPANPAKDLGLMNFASALPGSIVPALAPAILTIGATATMPQNFPALFISGAIAGLLGAAFIVPIRAAR